MDKKHVHMISRRACGLWNMVETRSAMSMLEGNSGSFMQIFNRLLQKRLKVMGWQALVSFSG